MKNINLSGLGISDLGRSSSENGKPLLISLDLIDEDPHNPRTEKNKGFSKSSIEALAETIKQKGVFDPICVKEAENGRYVINFGARRFRASKIAGKTEIPAFINNEFDDFSKGLENIQRHGLTPYEIADLLEKERAKGKTQDEIAKENGVSKGWVNQHLRLLDLPACLEKAWDREKITDVAATSELLSLIKKYGEEEIALWLDRQEEVSRTKIRAFKKVLEEEDEKEKSAADFLEESSSQERGAEAKSSTENDFGLVDTPEPKEIYTPQSESKSQEKSTPLPDFSLTEAPRELPAVPAESPVASTPSTPSFGNEAEEENENQEDFPFGEVVETTDEKLLAANNSKPTKSSSFTEEKNNEGEYEGDSGVPVSPTEELSEDGNEIIHNPKLIVEFYGKRAILLLHRKPSSEDKIWIKYHVDNIEAEVLSEQLSIKSLLEG